MTQPITNQIITITMPSSQNVAKTDMVALLKNVIQQGQSLSATVLDLKPGGNVSLEIGGLRINTQTNIPLQIGQQLQLQATVGQDKIELKLLQNFPRAEHSALRQAIRQAMPRQTSMQPLFDNISLMSKPPRNVVLPNIPLPAQRIIKSLANGLPTPKVLSTAAGVKQAVLNSGLFFESKVSRILQTKGSLLPLQQDLKSQLAKAIADLLPYQKQPPKPVPMQAPLKTATPAFKTPAQAAAGTEKKLTTQIQPPASNSKPNESATHYTAPKINPQTLAQYQKVTAPSPNNVAPSKHAAPTNATVTTTHTLPATSSVPITSSAPATSTASPTNNTASANNTVPEGSQHTSANQIATQKNTSTQQQNIRQQIATLQSIQNAEEALDEVVRQLTSSLTRVQFHQLTNLAAELQSPVLLYVEIPVQDNNRTDIVHMQLQEESSTEEEADNKIWRLTLSFDLQHLGIMQATLTLTKETVSVTLWTQQDWAKNLIDRQLRQLKLSFEEEGLVVEQLECHKGQAPNYREPNPLSLLDTKV